MKHIMIAVALSLALSACAVKNPDGSLTAYGQVREGFRQAGQDIGREFRNLRNKAADAIRADKPEQSRQQRPNRNRNQQNRRPRRNQ